MKKITLFISAAALIVTMSVIVVNILPVAQAVNASESVSIKETSVFSIEKMTCATCPITVRKAMEGVDGVESVSVDFDTKTATVIYDPNVATIEKVSAASTNAGYPATLNL